MNLSCTRDDEGAFGFVPNVHVASLWCEVLSLWKSHKRINAACLYKMPVGLCSRGWLDSSHHRDIGVVYLSLITFTCEGRKDVCKL